VDFEQGQLAPRKKG